MKNLKTLRRCFNFVEAESIRTRLDAAGILAVINGAESNRMLSYVGTALGGVQLEVAPEDYDRAVQLLEDDEIKSAAAGPWVCQACREQNEATFELCWNCQKLRDQADHHGDLDEAVEAAAEAPLAQASEPSDEPDDNNPYRPILLPKDTQVDRKHRR